MSQKPYDGVAAWPWVRKEKQQTGAAANVDLWAAPGSGISVVLHRIVVTANTAGTTIQVTEGADAAGTRIIDVYAPANGGIVLEFPFEAPYQLAANTALNLTTSGNNVKVTVWGWEKLVTL